MPRPFAPRAVLGLGLVLFAGSLAQATTRQDDPFAIPPDDPWYDADASQTPPTRSSPALAFKLSITPHWLPGRPMFWYRNDLDQGKREFILVDASRATRSPAFDHARMAAAIGQALARPFSADRLPMEELLEFEPGRSLRFALEGAIWSCDLKTYTCSKTAEKPRPQAPRATTRGFRFRPTRLFPSDGQAQAPAASPRSPDGLKLAYIHQHDVWVKNTEGDPHPVQLTHDGREGRSYRSPSWAGDSRHLIAVRDQAGDRKPVYLVQSSPPGGGRARMHSRPYDLPGDKLDSSTIVILDAAKPSGAPTNLETVDQGDLHLRWRADRRHFTYEKVDRGHQRYRLFEVDSHTGSSRTIIDEQSPTFIWTAHREAVALATVSWVNDNEILYASERDGWRRLYLIDVNTGQVKNPVTPAACVLRGLDKIDPVSREIWFHASGLRDDQDPYFVHYYRVRLDGTGLVALTEGDGDHTIQVSPDSTYLIDTYSRVDRAPIHEMRNVRDGRLILELERGDVRALTASGWKSPEVFKAKGRDGQTDIWGVIWRPHNFDPARRYPVIEQIYAGPQGSFTPKRFSAFDRYQDLTNLGFIVVQMDGMGTANRSKAFHDVCWRNLKDAGFEDRILWHKAVAARYPQYDLERLGIVGVSAGGQNAAAGVLFHPEFYKAAVAACGCHDNRMDKASWNEQWMGYPVGPWYSASSNIDNAGRLQGKLLLIVGELDSNVPPESTLRFADALIRAGKDFDLVVAPGANHGMGGEFGARKMRELFVRWLCVKQPPNPPSDASVGPARATAEIPARATAEIPARPAPKPTTSTPQSIAAVMPEPALWRPRPMGLAAAIDRYSVDAASFSRTLPPIASTDHDIQQKAFVQGWLEQLARLDFNSLDRDAQIDYLLFKNHLQKELAHLDDRLKQREDGTRFVPFAPAILELEHARRVLEPLDPEQVAARLDGLAKAVSQAAAEHSRGTVNAVSTRAASAGLTLVNDLHNVLRRWFEFYDGYDPLFSWWVDAPYKVADQALDRYASALRDHYHALPISLGKGGRGGDSTRPGGGGGHGGLPPQSRFSRGQEIVAQPIGRSALVRELQAEMIPYTPEELLALAENEMHYCETEMKKAAHAMGHGDNWKAALETVKNMHVPPGKQPYLIRDLALEAIDYLDRNNLVTIPPLCRNSWQMAMMSPEAQLVNPFFTGGPTITVSYPTSTMAHEAKMMSLRGNNIHFARATVHHELIPGHNLQIYMNSRNKPYRQIFHTPFAIEGWALYWELLLWDRGFAQSPENRVGMLFWRMHRCARILFSLDFHLEKLTPKQCVDMLVERVGHERDNAEAEVRRSFETGYPPLYQAAYLLGGMQLHALHHELVDSGKMTDRAFHDAVLEQNAIPIEMVRLALTHEKLSANFTPHWKFAQSQPPRVSTPNQR